MHARDRLTKVFNNAFILPYDSSSRIVIISDCHRGVGNWGDNFLKNQHLFFAALRHYDQQGFTYVELGDGDELWENRNMQQIIQVHSNTFWLMSKMYKDNRFHMLYGNHDYVKKDQQFLIRYCDSYYCENSRCHEDLFPGLSVHEGLILRHLNSGTDLFLTHGHQGEFLNDTCWRLSRFLVRYIWRPLELMGVNDPTSTAKNYQRKKKAENRLINWSLEHDHALVAGHTHRPSFPCEDATPYFNSGSCVHPRCITALEIKNDQISLVKWSMQSHDDLSLYVGREVLEGPLKLSSH